MVFYSELPREQSGMTRQQSGESTVEARLCKSNGSPYFVSNVAKGQVS